MLVGKHRYPTFAAQIILIMKTRTLLVALLTLSTATAKAQYNMAPANANRFSLTVGAGVTTLYGDLKTKQARIGYRGNLDYNFTPFISAGVEAQFGKLAEGDKTVTQATEGLFMESNYSAVNVNARLALGQFLGATDEDKLKEIAGGLYVGTGIGFISGNVSTIVTEYGYTKGPIKGTTTLKTSEVIIPINVGLNVNLTKELAGNLNLQYNMSQGETLDGYNFNVNANQKNDVYSFISVGIRYYFGGVLNNYYR